MMAVSATTTPAAPTGESRGSESSYNNSVPITPIGGGSGPAAAARELPLDPETSQLYSRLTHENLEKLATARNAAPVNAMLIELIRQGETAGSAGEDEAMDPSRIDGDKLFIVLRTLSREIGKVDQGAAAPIVLTILNFKQWSSVSPRVSDAYVQFLSVLASGNPRWWSEIAKRVVAQLAVPGLDPTPRHEIIRRILQIVPTAGASFGNIFASAFPHKSSPKVEVVAFVSNLLHIVDYAPDQASAVWELVTQRLIELDVECEGEFSHKSHRTVKKYNDDESGTDSDSDSDSDSDNDASSELASSDEEGYDSDDGSSEDEDDTSADETDSAGEVKSSEGAVPLAIDTGRKRSSDEESISSQAKRARVEVADGEEVTQVELDMMAAQQEPVSEKVDAVLTLLLSHLSRKFTDAAVQSGDATPLFKLLLDVFKKIVLPTSKPQATQFVWFFITHSHPDLLASFLSLLLETAMSPANSVDLRMRSMQYVASFVARAKGLSREQVVFVVSFLAEWIQRYMNERENEVDESASMARFSVFYAAVQALFYIFVFRHSMLRVTEDPEAGKSGWEAGLDRLFPKLINTKFNPLQYCMPNVVAMFARIAQDEEVASCYSIIERNRWGRFRAASKANATRNSGLASVSNYLFSNNRDAKLYHEYFPFQPLRLKESRKFVAPLYEKWSEHEVSDSDTEREQRSYGRFSSTSEYDSASDLEDEASSASDSE